MQNVTEKYFSFFLSVPALIWQLLFFYIPTILIIALSFVKAYGFGATLYYYEYFFQSVYVSIIMRSVLLATVTASLCLLIAYPVCYYIAVHLHRAKNILLFFLILPFWTSLLVQVYSWFFLLDRYGFINTILQKLHIINEPLALLNTSFAIYIVMIYCYIPFMIMPLYAQLEKLNKQLLEASADLGATNFQSFLHITLPLSLPGIKTGFFLVLVPSFGELIVPVLLGGGKQLFVGSVIMQFFLSTRDPHLGAAFTVISSCMLMLFVGIFYFYFSRFIYVRSKQA